MKKFCFLCGKEAVKLIESYCEECYNKKFSLIKVPKDMGLTICTKCEKIKFQNKWLDSNIEGLLLKKIKIMGKNVSIVMKRNEKFQIIAEGCLKGSKSKKKETHEINIKIKKGVCQACSIKFTGYYEAKIQLRGDTEKVIDFIDDEIRKAAIKDPKAFYRIETTKDGIDLFIGSKSVANTVSEKVKRRFNVKLKKSHKLITKKKGKEIYRDIIAIRI